MIFLDGKLIASGLRMDGRKGRFLKIIIKSKNPTLSKPVIKSDPKRVTKIGIRKSSCFVISIMIMAAEKVLVKADKNVAVPQRANSPGWTSNPNDNKISPKSLPKTDPIINAGVMIPLGIARVVSMKSINIQRSTITAKWSIIPEGHLIRSCSFLRS